MTKHGVHADKGLILVVGLGYNRHQEMPVKCPLCNGSHVRVVDSRIASEGRAIRRRRECLSCRYRFTTREEVEKVGIRVRKRDGSYQPFAINKVKHGVWRAIEKRQLTSERCEQLLRNIEEQILLQGREQKEMSSEDIGAIVLQHLQHCDHIAYLRFASVYKQFANIDELLQEINRLVNTSETLDGKR